VFESIVNIEEIENNEDIANIARIENIEDVG